MAVRRPRRLNRLSFPWSRQSSALGQRHRDIRRARIDADPLPRRLHDQIQVLHRNGAQQNLVAERQGARNADPVEHLDANRRNIAHLLHMSVGQRDFPNAGILQLKLQRNMFRDAKMHGPDIHQRHRLDFLQIGASVVAQSQGRVGCFHITLLVQSSKET